MLTLVNFAERWNIQETWQISKRCFSFESSPPFIIGAKTVNVL